MRNLAPSRVAAPLVIVLAIALAVGLARTYIGHSPGPYGNCFGPSGRPAPCMIVARTLTARDSAQLAHTLGAAKH